MPPRRFTATEIRGLSKLENWQTLLLLTHPTPTSGCIIFGKTAVQDWYYRAKKFFEILCIIDVADYRDLS